MQGSINGVSAASLAKQKEIVGNFVKRLQQNMKLEGFNIDYSGVYGYPNPALVKNRKMDAYELSMPVLPLYCENGQVKQAHETPYWVNIKINKIPYSGAKFFVPKLIDEEDPTRTGFTTLMINPSNKYPLVTLRKFYWWLWKRTDQVQVGHSLY